MSNPEAKPVKAAGGIVFKYPDGSTMPEVLMIYRNGYWDLPKGKLEKGESLEMCAVREVSEEVGSSLPALVSEVGTTYHEYPEKGKVVGKTTWWYSMILTRQEEFIPEEKEGIEKVEWVPFQKAIDRAGFDNLREILAKFSQ
ncbi:MULTISPECIES: NUDIX hydrolase [Gracilimonas]|uniref:NUDIX domain-containing protein n=1 Tax=Gracilimonas sediminicola TaxID=2952158 RepID=A0A9X2L3P2_9BACT|nr:NUDIX domain-containing protein [Gracilimonas sediminicola]MCP9291751.1 NUDIX domain-containing protein [Gracilimonas sediminicola]